MPPPICDNFPLAHHLTSDHLLLGQFSVLKCSSQQHYQSSSREIVFPPQPPTLKSNFLAPFNISNKIDIIQNAYEKDPFTIINYQLETETTFHWGATLRLLKFYASLVWPLACPCVQRYFCRTLYPAHYIISPLPMFKHLLLCNMSEISIGK